MIVRKHIALTFAVLVAVAASTLILGGEALAIGRTAPDSREYGTAGSNIRLSLSNVPSTKNITQIKVPIYIKAPAPTSPAEEASMKSSMRASVRLFDSVPISDYKSSLTNTYAGHAIWLDDGAAGRCSVNGGAVTLNAGNFGWLPEYGMWYTTVSATLRDRTCDHIAPQADNAQIDFRLQITQFTYQQQGFAPQTVTARNNTRMDRNDGNAYIAYAVPDNSDEDASSYYFSTNARVRSGGSAATYTIPFATPCSVVTDTPGTLKLYDLDNEHPDNNDLPVNVTVTDADSGVLVPTTEIRSGLRPGKGNGQTYRLSMNFQPGHRYLLNIGEIWHYNVLQYHLPYDTISYITGCPPGQLRPKLSTSLGLVTNVREGTSFTADFVLNSTSHSNVDASTFAQIWYENDNNGVFNPSDISVYTRDRNNPTWDTTARYGDTTVATSPPITVNGNLGSRICVSWNLRSTPTANTTIVEPRLLTQCFIILRSPPYVQIWGNDLRTGSSFGATNLNSSAVGSLSAAGGSWVEYAITAPNSVNLLASQSGAINGSSADQSQWSRLTFANNGSTCQYGCFAGPSELGRIPDIRNALTGVNITHQRTGPVSTADIASIAGNLNDVAGSNAIVTNGTITIDQNITYHSTGLPNSQSIPQLILVGRNINIAPNVTRVDAWLIADDTINTCSGIAQADLRSTNCQLPLRINGPLMASQLLLHRTYSNTADPSAAAEVINLRGDAYVWANRITKQNGSWQTTHTIELPPRY